MRQFGLIGYPLSHSFSKGYFTEKFTKEMIQDAQYENYPIASIESFLELWETNKELTGLNVTIPYKKEVIPFLDHPSAVVKEINACNCVRKYNGTFYGYNTDVIGFQKSLHPFLKPHHTKALILGTGGAAAAVEWVMRNLKIDYLLVSRSGQNSREANGNGEVAVNGKTISYEALSPEIIESHSLIINTSPLGMYPNVNEAPHIPYTAIGAQHHLFDLIYNPIETLFLQKGKAQGASIQNGMEMLYIQAEESWKIWNAETPVIQ